MQTPKFLELDDVLRIHERQIEKFGGTSGVRDQGLLDSALSQPQATFSGELLHTTVWEQAAAYLFHLAMNHPFLDGNKRNAFAVMDTFLRLNGFVLNLSQSQKYEFVIQVVERKLSKEDLASYLKQSCINRS
ncbi:MAG: type II toxin-antitoxin system death-on-curing family toxin [Myxacorys californica WJT36-NPBG1]|nr:type II toxin-antitoxin system death-on-curing family toxin [Myxacorys californica WJT36-NPBG1]